METLGWKIYYGNTVNCISYLVNMFYFLVKKILSFNSKWYLGKQYEVVSADNEMRHMDILKKN